MGILVLNSFAVPLITSPHIYFCIFRWFVQDASLLWVCCRYISSWAPSVLSVSRAFLGILTDSFTVCCILQAVAGDHRKRVKSRSTATVSIFTLLQFCWWNMSTPIYIETLRGYLWNRYPYWCNWGHTTNEPGKSVHQSKTEKAIRAVIMSVLLKCMVLSAPGSCVWSLGPVTLFMWHLHVLLMVGSLWVLQFPPTRSLK